MRTALGISLPWLLLAALSVGAEPGKTMRGAITDRHGEILAQTEAAFALRFIPDAQTQALPGAEAALAAVQKALGHDVEMSAETLVEQARNPAKKQTVAIDLDRPGSVAVTAAKLKNWEASEWQRRVYPQKRVAAHLVGYVGKFGTENGTLDISAGLEKEFEADLAKGAKLVTSLDLKKQRIVEKILEDCHYPGSILVLDAQNADVLAMVTWPNFDPNRFVPMMPAAEFRSLGVTANEPLFDRSLMMEFPPGVAVRPFVAAVMVRAGKLDATEKIVCEPATKIGNHIFKNWQETSELLDLAGAMRRAHHGYFFQATARMDGEKLLAGLAEFGFGQKSGLGLQETAATLQGPVGGGAWTPGYTANLSIGQGVFHATTLQLGRAMVAQTNGGALMRPRIALRMVAPEGKVEREFPEKKEREIALPGTARRALLEGMLAAVEAEDGTARGAKMTDLRVGGVTSSMPYTDTIQKVQMEFIRGLFVGFAPADKPRHVVVVLLDQCEGGKEAAAAAGKVLKAMER